MAAPDASLNASGTTAAAYFRLVGMLDVARKVRQYVHSEGAKASEIYQRTDLRTRQAERRVPKLAFLHADLAYQVKLLSKIVNQLAAAHDDAFTAYDAHDARMRRAVAALDAATATLARHVVAPELRPYATAADADAPLSLLAFVDADAVAGLRQAADASLHELSELYALGRRECLRLQDAVDAVLERAEGGAEGVVRPSPCEDCLYRQQLLCESLADVLDQVDAFVAKLQSLKEQVAPLNAADFDLVEREMREKWQLVETVEPTVTAVDCALRSNRDAVEEYAAWCEEAYSRQEQLLAELERLGPELESVSAQLASARQRLAALTGPLQAHIDEIEAVATSYLLFEEAYVRLLVELGRRQQHARQLEKLAADFARISAKLAADDAVAHEGFLARHGQHLPRVLANIARARPPIFRVERTDPDVLPVPELAPATIAEAHAWLAQRGGSPLKSQVRGGASLGGVAGLGASSTSSLSNA